MSYERISVDGAKEIIAAGRAVVIDVRDPHSYAAAHIENALHLDDSTLCAFLASTDRSAPLIVYCYHGNSSQGAADFFSRQGFVEVYSMDGGFEAWG